MSEPEIRYCKDCGVDFFAKHASQIFCRTKRCIADRQRERNMRVAAKYERHKSNGRYAKDPSFYMGGVRIGEERRERKDHPEKEEPEL